MDTRWRGTREKCQNSTFGNDEEQAEEIAGASKRIQYDVKNLYLELFVLNKPVFLYKRLYFRSWIVLSYELKFKLCTCSKWLQLISAAAG